MAILNRMPGSQFAVYEWLTDAMDFFDKAQAIRPPGNDDAILRWNTCARLIMRHHLKPLNEKYVEPPLEWFNKRKLVAFYNSYCMAGVLLLYIHVWSLTTALLNSGAI